ncbi:MAG: hypothetical protein AABZ47_01740 [Planctomycetota bacterium]
MTLDKPRPRIRRYWVTCVVTFILLVSIFITAALLYREAVHPDRIRAMVENAVQRHLGGRFTVGQASFTWLEGVRLSDVAIDMRSSVHRPEATSPPPLFYCRQITVGVQPFSALWGPLQIDSVTAIDPVIRVVRSNVETGTTLKDVFSIPQDQEAEPSKLPKLDVRGGRILIIDETAGRSRTVSDLAIAARARPDPTNSGAYEISWESTGRTTENGQTIFNVAKRELVHVRGGLPTIPLQGLTTLAAAASPTTARRLEELGISGRARITDYQISWGNTTPKFSLSLQCGIDGISIPVSDEERTLPASERFLRFQNLSARIDLGNDHIEVSASGAFHDGTFHLDSTARGDLLSFASWRDLSVDAAVQWHDVTVPRSDSVDASQKRLIESSSLLLDMHEDYNPRGRADVSVEITRESGLSSKFKLRRLLLVAKGGTASCRFFPYTLSDVLGSVEYDGTSVSIRDLCGKRGEGHVCINGWIAETNRCAPIDLHIEATNLTIDDELCAGLPPQYDRLRRDWNPQGTVELLLSLYRRPCVNYELARWESECDVHLTDVMLTHDCLPYPLENLRGPVEARKNSLRWHDLQGFMLSSPLKTSGEMNHLTDGRSIGDILVGLDRVPITSDVLNSIHDPIRRRMLDLQPRGEIDADIQLHWDEFTDEISHRVNLFLRDVSLQPPGNLPILTSMNGELSLANNSAELREVTAEMDRSQVVLNGRIKVDDEASTMDLVIHSDNFFLSPSLREALPVNWRSGLKPWTIDGPLVLDARIRSGVDDPRTSVEVSIQLGGATVHHQGIPAPLTDTHGEITWFDNKLQLDNLSARYGDAEVRGSATALVEPDQHQLDATVVIAGLSLNPTTLGLLPLRLARTISNLNATGLVDLTLDRLHVHQTGSESLPHWTVEGYADLREVRATGALDLNRLDGQLEFNGGSSPDGHSSAFRGKLYAPSLVLQDRQLTNLVAPWSFASTELDRSRLTMPSVQALLYSGQVMGDFDWEFDPRETNYRLTLKLHGMDIEPFLNAISPQPSDRREPLEVAGVVDAQFQLSGIVGDPQSRKGLGRIQVLQGRLYRLPIMLAILQVINLSVPNEDVFEDAHADLFIHGNQIELSDIQLRGKAIALIGSGTLSWPDKSVDLSLVSISPHLWAQLPLLSDLVESISREIVELHVTGPLSRPVVRPRTLRGLTEELKNLFKKRQPRPIRPVG